MDSFFSFKDKINIFLKVLFLYLGYLWNLKKIFEGVRHLRDKQAWSEAFLRGVGGCIYGDNIRDQLEDRKPLLQEMYN